MQFVRTARRRRITVAAALVALAVAPAMARAQQPAAPTGSEGWKWALDRPARMTTGGKAIGTDSLFEFSLMAPGWHVTMGPGAVLYDARETADHRFVVTAEMILFPDASMDGEYGIFVGGRELDAAATKQWYAFVVRGDGSAAVMHRAGPETHMVFPWTKFAGVKPRPDGATATNALQLRAEPDSIRFFVNGERITAFARAALDVNGPFGLRVGRGVNLHITNLDLTRRLAPFPQRR
jgi:hypothetical protein